MTTTNQEPEVTSDSTKKPDKKAQIPAEPKQNSAPVYVPPEPILLGVLVEDRAQRATIPVAVLMRDFLLGVAVLGSPALNGDALIVALENAGYSEKLTLVNPNTLTTAQKNAVGRLIAQSKDRSIDVVNVLSSMGYTAEMFS